MKFKKIISSALALGLLLNSVSVSLASVLSEDCRYETFEGNSITINDLLETDKVDIEIEGNTLVNLAPQDWIMEDTVTGHGIFDKSNKIYTAHCDGTYSHFAFTGLALDIIKPNTNYTLIFKTTREGSSLNKPVQLFNVTEMKYYSTERRISISEGTQYHKVLIDVNDDFLNSEIKNRMQMRITLNNITDGSLKLSEIILLKGDWTDKETPKYFEGVKSVGQNDANDHKIEIVSQNKNLFDGEWLIDTAIGIEEHYYYGENYYSPGYSATKNYIKVKPSEHYCNNKSRAWLIEYDKNYNVVRYNTGYTQYQMTPKTHFIRFYVNNSNADNFMFEKGNIKTSYVSQKIDKKEVLLSQPLRSLPNGVKDRIIKRNGQWVVERNLGEVVLDGSENWTYNPTLNNSSEYQIYTVKFNFNINNRFINTDKIVPLEGNYLDEKEYVALLTPGGTQSIGVKVKKDRLDSQDVDGFKNWISNNNITMIYSLINPVYEPLNIESCINTYLETTYISNNSTIPCNMKVTIDRTINRAVDAIRLAEENPTVSNISMARMWINLLKESTIKDDLHNQTNNIVDIVDLSIEKKKVTGNVDIYVKSDNMLSMSLSTNSITFDNFTGIDDMELDNALNITINSSLPYGLNSYLLSDLQNADGSVTMNRDLLNIKMNNDVDYKVFTNLNEKVVLEDDCNSGNNNHHIINFKLNGSNAHKADIYKAVIKFEAEQK